MHEDSLILNPLGDLADSNQPGTALVHASRAGPDDATMSGRGSSTPPVVVSLARLISNSPLRPKPGALSHHGLSCPCGAAARRCRHGAAARKVNRESSRLPISGGSQNDRGPGAEAHSRRQSLLGWRRSQ